MDEHELSIFLTEHEERIIVLEENMKNPYKGDWKDTAEWSLPNLFCITRKSFLENFQKNS